MWSLRQREDGTVYLTFDHNRRFSCYSRGVWEFVGKTDNENTQDYVAVNEAVGYICCEDDQGATRVLILE